MNKALADQVKFINARGLLRNITIPTSTALNMLLTREASRLGLSLREYTMIKLFEGLEQQVEELAHQCAGPDLRRGGDIGKQIEAEAKRVRARQKA